MSRVASFSRDRNDSSSAVHILSSIDSGWDAALDPADTGLRAGWAVQIPDQMPARANAEIFEMLNKINHFL